MRFRFILQPLMAAILSIRDGLSDARTGRSPFLSTVLRNPQERNARLREGLNATAHVDSERGAHHRTAARVCTLFADPWAGRAIARRWRVAPPHRN